MILGELLLKQGTIFKTTLARVNIHCIKARERVCKRGTPNFAPKNELSKVSKNFPWQDDFHDETKI